MREGVHWGRTEASCADRGNGMTRDGLSSQIPPGVGDYAGIKVVGGLREPVMDLARAPGMIRAWWCLCCRRSAPSNPIS